jgi:hypothetical protein
MLRTVKQSGVAALVLFAACLLPAARGVIFYATGDPTYNTSAPTGSLAGSGWQWVGIWGGYEGTPIGANYFLTARHVGGNVGDPFIFGGVTYTTTAFFDDTSTDLRICEVSGTFPAWAPIYRSSGEVGQGLVVIGEGDGQGNPVEVDGMLKGWMWGSGAGTMRWGQNTFDSVVDGGSYWGSLLYALFQAGQGPSEADLANGDSSSPVFINDGSGWELAGIGAAVDGPFNTTDTGEGFDAAIFDASDLYYQDNGSWVLIPGPGPVPTGFYATRVSVRAAWIDSIVPSGANCSDTPLFSGPEAAILAAVVAGIGAWRARRVAPAGGAA